MPSLQQRQSSPWWRRYISLVGLLLIWEGASRGGLIPAYYAPPPSLVLVTVFQLAVEGTLWPHLAISLFRAFAGFSIGASLGILLGVLAGSSRLVSDLADVPLQVLRAVPLAALVPMAILWFGVDEGSKVFIVALPPFFLCFINSMQGVRHADASLVRAARSLGANQRQILLRVLVPAASPSIFAGIRLGVVVSMVMLVIAEMIAAGAGLGYYILEAHRLWMTEQMFAGVAVISALGFLFDRAVVWTESRVLRWTAPEQVS
jgi:ABC-type nitrate/sulfonate/bicarbonate transport system permease component